MTRLRRIAQLVEDLRTVNVIKEGDSVEFRQYYDGEVVLKIRFNSLSLVDNVNYEPMTAKNAIQKEFETLKFLELKLNGNEVYCRRP